MAIAQKVAGLHARPGRHPAPRDGQEEEVRARQAVRGLLGRHEGERLLAMPRCKTLWDILLPFSDYAFNKAHSAAYGVLIATGPRTSRRTIPAEYMAALLTSVGDAQGQARASTSTSAAAWASRCSRPTSNESIRLLRRRRRRHPLRARRGAQRRLERRRRASSRRARRRAASSRSTTSSRKVPIHVANKRTVESLIKAGAFDSLGSTRRALMEIHEDAVERGRRGQARRGERRRSGSTSTASTTSRRGHAGEGARPAGVDQEGQARVRARDARAVRLRPPARRARDPAREARVDQHPRPARRRRTSATATRSPSPGSSRACSTASRKSSGNQYGMITVEDFDGEVTVMFMGKTYTGVRARCCMADSILVVRGRVSASRRRHEPARPVSVSAPTSGRATRRARSCSRCPSIRATTDVDQALDDVLIRHRGRHRGAAAPACAGAPRACSSCRTRCR